MRTKLRILFSLLILAAILITAIPSVKDKLIDLTDDIGKTALTDFKGKYDVNIHFLPTGTSDCIILDLDGEYVLIDGGFYGMYDRINTYFQEVGIDKFSAVINTHPDADHVGCIPQILYDYKVQTLFYSETAIYSDSVMNSEMLKAAETSNIHSEALKEKDSFTINGFKFEVLAPYTDADENNSMSLVIKVSKDDFSMLLTGDSDKEVLLGIEKRGYSLDCDILKVPHHGSSTSTNDELLNLFSPEYAVITVGENSYGIPDPEALSLFEEKKIPLLRTDQSGTIIISSNCDGKYIVNSIQSGG